MKLLRFYLSLCMMALAVTAFGQSRDINLQISVTAATGESLEGQAVQLTWSGILYPSSETVLDKDGKLSIKIYPGSHHIKIERTGYATFEQDFTASADMSLPVTLTEAVRNPFALKSEVTHDVFTGKNSVKLSWNREDPAFFDDFESYAPFAVEFSPWTGIDGDRIAAAALTGSYPNRGALQYAQIINPMAVEPSWWQEYPVLRPYSGQQYVGFIRTQSGAANNDWLISPEITVGTNNIVRFMAKAADVYKERFTVGITTASDPSEDDFTIISAGNYESVSYEQWQAMEYDLSAYAGQQVRIGIHFISSANRGGSFMLMVDDFFVGQADYFDAEKASKARRVAMRSPANPNERFELYKNGEKVGETDSYSYLFDGLDAGSYRLGVKAVYRSAESDMAELPVEIQAGDYAKASFRLTTNNGVSPDGLSVELTDKATGAIYTVDVAENSATIPSLPKATYLVGVASDMFEPYQSELALDGDKTVDIPLKEKIFDPYNITVDQTDAENGTVEAVVKWNQDLGFTDSFETYDDFATEKFGDWTSIDVDRGVVYPIALGNQTNIVTFPGASTPQNPAAIAPMVFNPYKTTPVMAPTDEAIVPPTGEKTVIFFSPQQATASKWLISPKQVVRNGYVCRFTLKAYSSLYSESFEICVSTTDNAVSSFTAIDKITVPADYWQTYSIDLSAYAGQEVYIGFHYVSYDAFFSQLDDFYIGPENAADAYVGNVKSYKVTLDGAFAAETQTPSYTFPSLTKGEHTVGITAVYASGQSAEVTYTFNAQGGVEETAARTATAIGGKGVVRLYSPQAAEAVVCNMQGQLVARAAVEGEATVTLPAGIYAVRIGGQTAKVIVK